jgi:hypothetical protein
MWGYEESLRSSFPRDYRRRYLRAYSCNRARHGKIRDSNGPEHGPVTYREDRALDRGDFRRVEIEF